MKRIIIILCTAILCLSASTWSSKDHYCMTQAIYHESRAESYIGKVAVGHVILNRIASGRGINPCDIISQKKQFSWFGKRLHIKEKRLWKECSDISELILDNRTTDPTKGSQYFDNKNRRHPKWKKTILIGNHMFYK